MGLFKTYKTDKTKEAEGVWFYYTETTRVRLSRAGGTNQEFAKRLERLTKPHRRAIQMDMLEDALALQIMRRVYAEVVVKQWQTGIAGEWKDGIENPDGGELLPVSVDNIIKTFVALPDLFLQMQDDAQKAAMFRDEVRENDSKN